jgi:Domain of unknown function (DUF5134)
VVMDLTVRWMVTILFTLGAAGCVSAVVASDRRTPRFVVSQALHVLMATAMVAMAWPSGARLPTVGPMLVFLLAAGWFVAAAVIDPDHWVSGFYHATMMFAMAWMYAVMNGAILPGHANSGAGGGHHHGAAAATMPDMPGMAGMESTAAAAPPYIGALNWFATVGFGVAAVWWLYRHFARRGQRSGPAAACPGERGQAMMAAGMAIMFAVMG